MNLDVAKMSDIELEKELTKQSILYSTENDTNKANKANFNMMLIMNEIQKREGVTLKK